ncbi:hypothetical protein EG68_07584 [Paragonimus skrjabini miyazakii]|uniref:Uncharacterized protein n=1 Tax=Paragonimus skrjabini miyazakii TaxID=59628 RepID=A0A8S9YN48_9TREM|nr:hypothetical protein EG68_07584 [Paragonimus skrjabini miyazakii]
MNHQTTSTKLSRCPVQASTEALVCSSLGIQPGIVKQNKEKFASETDFSSVTSMNNLLQFSRNSSANARLTSEFENFMAKNSSLRDRLSGHTILRHPIPNVSKDKFSISEGNIHESSIKSQWRYRSPSPVRLHASKCNKESVRSSPVNFTNNNNLETITVSMNPHRSTGLRPTNYNVEYSTNHSPSFTHAQRLKPILLSSGQKGEDTSHVSTPLKQEVSNKVDIMNKSNQANEKWPSVGESSCKIYAKVNPTMAYQKHLPFSYIHSNDNPRALGMRKSNAELEDDKSFPETQSSSAVPFSYILNTPNSSSNTRTLTTPTIRNAPSFRTSLKEAAESDKNKLQLEPTGLKRQSVVRSMGTPDKNQNINKSSYSSSNGLLDNIALRRRTTTGTRTSVPTSSFQSANMTNKLTESTPQNKSNNENTSVKFRRTSGERTKQVLAELQERFSQQVPILAANDYQKSPFLYRQGLSKVDDTLLHKESSSPVRQLESKNEASILVNQSVRNKLVSNSRPQSDTLDSLMYRTGTHTGYKAFTIPRIYNDFKRTFWMNHSPVTQSPTEKETKFYSSHKTASVSDKNVSQFTPGLRRSRSLFSKQTWTGAPKNDKVPPTGGNKPSSIDDTIVHSDVALRNQSKNSAPLAYAQPKIKDNNSLHQFSLTSQHSRSNKDHNAQSSQLSISAAAVNQKGANGVSSVTISSIPKNFKPGLSAMYQKPPGETKLSYPISNLATNNNNNNVRFNVLKQPTLNAQFGALSRDVESNLIDKLFAKTTRDNKLNKTSLVCGALSGSNNGQDFTTKQTKESTEVLSDRAVKENIQSKIDSTQKMPSTVPSLLRSQSNSQKLSFQEAAKKSLQLAPLAQKTIPPCPKLPQELKNFTSNKLGKKNTAENLISDPSNDSCKTDSKPPSEKISEKSPALKYKGPVLSACYAELTPSPSFEKSFNWRQSNNTIRKRPEYSELAQKLEEQFKSGGSLTRSQIFGMQTHVAKAKSEDIPPEELSEDQIPQQQTAVEEPARAPMVKSDIIRASVPNLTAESPLQPVKKQLLMELTERLAKRSGSTTTDENSWITEPEPQRSVLRPQLSETFNAIERLESELSPHGRCPTNYGSDLPNKTRPWSPTSLPPPSLSPPPTLSPPQPPPPPPPLLPPPTTTGTATATTTRPPLPPPLHLLLSKFSRADERVCAPWQPVNPVLRPYEPCQIQTKDEIVDGHDGDEDVDGAGQQQLEKREELKPPHISFPPDDKLITTHDYVTDAAMTSKEPESEESVNDLRALQHSGPIQLHTGSGDETSDTGCSTESLRKSVLDRKRKLFPLSHTVPDLTNVHTQLEEFISKETNEQPRHFTRWRPHDFGQENSNSQFERPQSAPAVAQNSINLTVPLPPPPPLPLPPNPPQIPKRPQTEKPWKPYPVYLF